MEIYNKRIGNTHSLPSPRPLNALSTDPSTIISLFQVNKMQVGHT